jgi:hypothetical protein
MNTCKITAIARSRRSSLNRRSTLMLAIGGIFGLATRARAEPATTQVPNLKAVGSDRQVAAIRHDREIFEVATADGRSTVFPAVNLRFKIDASDNGPPAGRPVILPGGMMGDRATVFFASAAEIGELIKYRG